MVGPDLSDNASREAVSLTRRFEGRQEEKEAEGGRTSEDCDTNHDGISSGSRED
jgi:hypothetical protein